MDNKIQIITSFTKQFFGFLSAEPKFVKMSGTLLMYKTAENPNICIVKTAESRKRK